MILKFERSLLSGHGEEAPMEKDVVPTGLVAFLLLALVVLLGVLLVFFSQFLPRVYEQARLQMYENTRYEQLEAQQAKDEGRLRGYEKKADGRYRIPIDRAIELLSQGRR